MEVTEQKIYTCQMCRETFLDPDEGKILVVLGVGFVIHSKCMTGGDND